ncbi:MAG: signal peptidase I, partial [Porcipelethomonas sp.]
EKNEALNGGADAGAGDKAAEDGEKGKGSLLDDIVEIAESVIISVFVVLLIFTFIARPVTVDGRSMSPTLENEDKLVMRTFLYSPEAGDIVIIDNNTSYTYKEGTSEIVEGQSLEKRLIKRVIALGGQTVDIDFNTGTVKVDGEVLEEEYIADVTHFDPGAFDYPVTVPEGYIFVMGDNRNNSTDSRDNHVGFVKEEDVLGKAILRFYPFDKFKLLD